MSGVYTHTVTITREQIPSELIEDLKVLYGLPPHNSWSNSCMGDGYFSESLRRKFGDNMIAAATKLVINPMRAELAAAQGAIESKYR